MSAPHDPWKNVETFIADICLRDGDMLDVDVCLRTAVDAARSADATEIATLRATVDQQAETIRQLQATVDDRERAAMREAVSASAFRENFYNASARAEAAEATVDQQQARITALEAALKEAHALMRLFQTCYPAAIASLPDNAMERFRQALETP